MKRTLLFLALSPVILLVVLVLTWATASWQHLRLLLGGAVVVWAIVAVVLSAIKGIPKTELGIGDEE